LACWRKTLLKKLLRRKRASARLLYLDHVESDGVLLIEEAVKPPARDPPDPPTAPG